MKARALVLSGLIWVLAPFANAQKDVVFILRKTFICDPMDIPNASAVEVSSGDSYAFIRVLNESSVGLLFCAPRADVTVSGSTRGWKIKSEESELFHLPIGGRLWCISNIVPNSTAIVCKGI